MNEEKIAKYKARIDPLLERLREKYSEKLDYEEIIPLFKEAEEDGIRIDKDLKEQYDKYYKIVNAYIERPLEEEVIIKTHGPVTPKQFYKLLDKRKKTVERCKARLDYLLDELECGSKNVEKKILELLGAAKREYIDPKKDLGEQFERYLKLSGAYKE